MPPRFPALARPARPDDRPIPFVLTCLRAGTSLARQAALLFGLCAALLAAGPISAQAQSPVSTVKDDQGNDLMQIFDNGNLELFQNGNLTLPGTVESTGGGFVLPDGTTLSGSGDLGGLELPFEGSASTSFGNPLLNLEQTGDGRAGIFAIDNKNNGANALSAATNGGGSALAATAIGSGDALFARATGSASALEANANGSGEAVNAFNLNDGSGLAGRFQASNSGGAGDPDNHVVFVKNTGGLNSDGLAIQAGPDVEPAGAVNFLTFYDGDGDIVGQIEGDGDGGIDIRGLNTGTSDRRLKTGIEPLGEKALRKLADLRPVRYEFNDQETYPSGEQIGLIAQDVQKELPSLVSEGSDGMLSLDYPKLTAVLLKGLQEQQAQIDSLEQQVRQIEVLKKRLTRLEARPEGNSVLAGWPGTGLLLGLLAGGLLGLGLARRRS